MQGVGFDVIAEEMKRRHEMGYPDRRESATSLARAAQPR